MRMTRMRWERGIKKGTEHSEHNASERAHCVAEHSSVATDRLCASRARGGDDAQVQQIGSRLQDGWRVCWSRDCFRRQARLCCGRCCCLSCSGRWRTRCL